MKQIELWEKVKNDEKYKVFDCDFQHDGVILKNFEEFIGKPDREYTGSDEEMNRIMGEYLYFRTGFHYATRAMARAFEDAFGITIGGAAK